VATRTFDIARNVIFLVAICILCSYIHRPYDAADGVFEGFYKKQEAQLIAIHEKADDLFKRRMDVPGEGYKVKPFYDRFLSADSVTKKALACFSKVPVDNKLADSLQNVYDNTIAHLLSYLPTDSAWMRPYTGLGEVIYVYRGRDGRWLFNILKKESPERKQLLFALLRSKIYGVQAMIDKRLTEYGRPGGCYYDSVTTITRTNNNIFTAFDTIRVRGCLAVFLQRLRIDHYYNDKRLSFVNKVGKFEEVAGSPGDHIVSGYSTYSSYMDDAWEKIPWSFKYRVIGKGTCLTLGAHQYCYRHVPNPVTVSIPGYPPDKVRLWSKQAKLVHKAGAQWDIIVADTSLDSVIVYADATDVHGHTATVHAVAFAVRNLDNLRLMIDGEERTTMPAEDLLKGHKINAVDEVSGISVRVIGYELVIINAHNKLAGIFTVNKNEINEGDSELKQTLSALTPGAHVYISNVVAEHNLPVAGAGIKIE
jgi:hypothetical protein